MSFKRIWTTNYDSLLENSFRVHHNVLVVKKDDDLKQVPHKNDITIIKMHGSYDELDSVVLTSSDYDKYFATHPLISEQFSASLVNRSFLFIGYSYNDPDIRSIMTEAQVKLHGTQNHYLITRAPQRDCPDESNKDFEYRQLMFNSWKTELNRLGIHVLEIERYNQLEEVLLEILIKARGNNVFVTGSHNNNTTIAHQDAIVSSLLKNNAVFVYGQSSGIGLSYLNAFCEKAAQEKIDIGNRIRFFSNPYSINSSFSNDKSLIPELKRLRYDLFKNTRLMIFYPGGMGTLAELELALEHHCLVLPIVSKDESYNNEVVKAFFEAPNALKQLDKVSPQYAEALSKRKIPSVDILGHTISQCLEV